MATTPTPAPGPSTSAPQISTVGRLTGALFSPKPTFADIARSPSWIVPVLLICLLSFVVTGIFGQRVGWRGLIEKKMADNKRFEQLPPDQKERIIEQQTKYAPIFGYVGIPIFIFGGALIGAGVLLGAFNVTSGAELNFKTSLGIVTHSWMPAVIQQILGIVILFVKSPDTIDIEHLVASNCGAFLSDDAPKWLMSICTSLDLFTFWTLFLAAMGFAVARPKKISMGSALGTVVGLWVVWILVKAGLAAVFS
ncbi:MAG: YIP1 family protein [Candidatus Acidiferrales bacterium]